MLLINYYARSFYILSTLYIQYFYLLLLLHSFLCSYQIKKKKKKKKSVDLLDIMASDETMTVLSSMHDEDFDDTDDGYDHHHQPHNLSRLSVCTSSMYTNEDDDDGEGTNIYMSRLSIESFDGDADEEFSDEKEFKGLAELSSDSDKEAGWYSMPATPSRRSARRESISQEEEEMMGAVKDYASENEAQKGRLRQKVRRNLRRRRTVNSSKYVNKKGRDNNSASGESDQSGGCGSGVVVITRPKGGRRSLCMGLEEMKACRDLGFELEHERTLEIPGRVSLSGSTLDTSSGGNSPIANWRISSPGNFPLISRPRLQFFAFLHCLFQITDCPY